MQEDVASTILDGFGYSSTSVSSPLVFSLRTLEEQSNLSCVSRHLGAGLPLNLGERIISRLQLLEDIFPSPLTKTFSVFFPEKKKRPFLDLRTVNRNLPFAKCFRYLLQQFLMSWILRKCQLHDNLPLLMSYLMFSVLKIYITHTLQPYSDLLILSEKNLRFVDQIKRQ